MLPDNSIGSTELVEEVKQAQCERAMLPDNGIGAVAHLAYPMPAAAPPTTSTAIATVTGLASRAPISAGSEGRHFRFIALTICKRSIRRHRSSSSGQSAL